MGVAMDFPVANVRLETGMRLLNGNGTFLEGKGTRGSDNLLVFFFLSRKKEK
jgi:hypothetical protein